MTQFAGGLFFKKAKIFWHSIKPGMQEFGTTMEQHNTKEQQNMKHQLNSKTS